MIFSSIILLSGCSGVTTKQDMSADDMNSNISAQEYADQDLQFDQAKKNEIKKREKEDKQVAQEAVELSKGMREEYESSKSTLIDKLKITDKDLELELIRSDGVGGIGLSLGETLFRIYRAKDLYKFKESTVINPAGKHLIINSVSTRTHKRVAFHFLVNEEHAILQSVVTDQAAVVGYEAVMGLMLVFQNET